MTSSTEASASHAHPVREEMQQFSAPPNATAVPHPRQLDAPAGEQEDEKVSRSSAPHVLQAYENDDPTWLKPHRTRLPNFLYLLSFAPPIEEAFKSPRAFISHPYVLYFIGTLSALAAGASVPALDILYGYWTNGITPASATPADILARSSQVGWIMTVCGIGCMTFSWLFLVCFSTAAHNLTVRLRHTYVASVLIQDQTFFDVIGPGEISARAGKDITTIRVGLGEKIAYFTWSLSTLLVGIISAFSHVPRLAGFLFALIPFSVIIFAILGKATEVVGAPALTVEGRAASLVEQMLSSVRIIQAFGMRPHIIRRLNEGMLAKLQRLGLGRSLIRGIEQSAIYFVLNTSYAIAFWWGGRQVIRGAENGNVLTTFWNNLNAIFAIANAVPHLAGIFDSYTALGLLRKQIERQPQIDVRQRGGLTSTPSQGKDDEDRDDDTPTFELQNVTFAYPSRAYTKSLNDVSVRIERGQVTAFVGPSGSGKSTVASLFLREYDPETANIRNPADPLPEHEEREQQREKEERKKDAKAVSKKLKHSNGVGAANSAPGKESPADIEDLEDTPPKSTSKQPRTRVQGGGRVLYAGRDVREYNLRWLRSRIAVVSQHPQLFTASIFENVAAGLTGTQWAFRPDIDLAPDADAATKHKVELIKAKCEEALRKADAWTFVSKLPEGMATVVSGGRSGLLSGGQRQRIAIARALVREPEVLILDEGTSALDSATEDRIKVMLQEEQRRRGMTLILIAHRLSTIAQADKIVVVAAGKVLDQGKYDELISPKRKEGTFREMALAQQAVLAEADDEKRAEDPESDEHADEKLDYVGNDAPAHKRSRPPSAGLQRVSTTATSMTMGTTLAPASEVSVGYGSENNDSVSPLNQRPRATPVQDGSSSSKAIRPSFSGRGGLGQVDHTTAVPDSQGDALSLIASRTSALQRQESRGSQRAPSHKEKNTEKDDASQGDEEPPAMESPMNPHPDRSRNRVVLRRLFRVLYAQKWFFLIGISGAVAGGASFPIAGWMTGPAVEALSIQGNDPELRSETAFWAQWFFILACVDLVIFLINAFFLELASEATVRKLKVEGLAALLKQEVGFFDHEDSASGALTSAVSSHPANVGAATGLILSQVILSCTNLLGAVLLALVISWKAAIVCLAPIFVLFVSGYAQVWMMEKYEAAASKPAARAAAYINEAMDTVRTVSALGREAETMRAFDSEARSDTRRGRFLLLGATGFGVSQGMILYLSALVFYWGGRLYSEGSLSLKDLYAVFEGIIIGAFSGGRIFTFVGDYSRAFSSFAILESWLSRKPRVAKAEVPAGGADGTVTRVTGTSASGEALSHPTQGDIVFSKVEMRYPQRPKYPALRCVDLHIKAGTNVAFCGTSGSGKSSILSLLQRFYDPSEGTITFGGVDASAMSLDELRTGMAYVSQDPVLFEGSLRWNLTLGSNDPDAVTDTDIEAACEQACILDFVRGLEHGLDTDIGMKGAQLSGGQKQRLCIARVLLRNAPILCLDEATSALDPTSEKAVQRALDRASRGRTTITIAHRLSTIRNADVIHVVEDGAIVESGSHDELIQRKGRYLDLVAAQI